MRIEKISIDQLKFAPYNPRKIKSSEFEKLKKSIKTYNCYEPLIVNSRAWHIIGGNQRLRALLELGYKEVDVVILDLSLEKEQLLNLALNRIQGEFDFDKLPSLIDELSKISDIDLSLSGFDSYELDKFLEGIREPKDPDDFDFDAAIAAIKDPVAQKGDLIELGPHRIYCGDTTQVTSLRNVLGKDRIGLLHMDNPYGVSYDAQNRPGSHKDTCWKAIQNDELKGKDHVDWFKKMLITIKPFLKPNASFYFWDGFINFGPITQVLAENGFHVSNVITWVKPTACPSFADYWFQNEFLLYGWLKSGISHRWFGANGESNIWKVDREPIRDLQHPTMKPTELARRVIKNSSVRGDIVFDGCMGAGFNLLACQQLNRVFRGIDIEPVYVDIAIHRYIRMFGRNSVSAEILKKYSKEDSRAQ